MAILYKTLDSQGKTHNYFAAGNYVAVLGKGKAAGNGDYFPFVGGAILGKDFDIAFEERRSFFRNADPIFVRPGTLADIDLARIARRPASIGDHLIIINPNQDISGPGRGFEFLPGAVTAVERLDKL